MCCPSNDELMIPLMSLLRARETLYPQMCLLKGKLELIKGHVAAKQYKADVPNTALFTYEDGKYYFTYFTHIFYLALITYLLYAYYVNILHLILL